MNIHDPLLPDARVWSDLFSSSREHDTHAPRTVLGTRKKRITSSRLEHRTNYTKGTVVIERLVSAGTVDARTLTRTWCTATLTPALHDTLAGHLFCVNGDEISFDVFMRDDEPDVALVFARHSLIIGSRLVARLDASTLPELPAR